MSAKKFVNMAREMLGWCGVALLVLGTALILYGSALSSEISSSCEEAAISANRTTMSNYSFGETLTYQQCELNHSSLEGRLFDLMISMAAIFVFAGFVLALRYQG